VKEIANEEGATQCGRPSDLASGQGVNVTRCAISTPSTTRSPTTVTRWPLPRFGDGAVLEDGAAAAGVHRLAAHPEAGGRLVAPMAPISVNEAGPPVPGTLRMRSFFTTSTPPDMKPSTSTFTPLPSEPAGPPVICVVGRIDRRAQHLERAARGEVGDDARQLHRDAVAHRDGVPALHRGGCQPPATGAAVPRARTMTPLASDDASMPVKAARVEVDRQLAEREGLVRVEVLHRPCDQRVRSSTGVI
jgi:hypothetical protein